MLELCGNGRGEYWAGGEAGFERVRDLMKELRDSAVVYAVSNGPDWEEAVRSLGAIVTALAQVEQHARYMQKVAGRRLRQIAKAGPKAAKEDLSGVSLADLIGHRAVAVAAIRRR
jgi:hypothetical protein